MPRPLNHRVAVPVLLATVALCSTALSPAMAAAEPTVVDRWLASAAVESPPPADAVAALKLSPWYRKHVRVMGLSVVGSDQVTDAALLEAGYLIHLMLQDRPDVAAAMAARGTRFAVMAAAEMTTDVPEHSDLKPKAHWDRRARGLGATRQRPAVSCGEENLLQCPGDPYAKENILIHEFAHAIHQMGLNHVDPTFDKRLKAAFDAATAKGLWKGADAATNHHEYWAEAVQSYFGTNRENDNVHNHVNTRDELVEYDPDVATLVAEAFKGATWTYVPPTKRWDQPHLKGVDRATLPRFKWPSKGEEDGKAKE
jgi:hypothetical protein